MNENENKQQGQFQIELPQETAQGEYANFAIITHSSSDFVLDFAAVSFWHPNMPNACLWRFRRTLCVMRRSSDR